MLFQCETVTLLIGAEAENESVIREKVVRTASEGAADIEKVSIGDDTII